jgi:hypothetical protein
MDVTHHPMGTSRRTSFRYPRYGVALAASTNPHQGPALRQAGLGTRRLIGSDRHAGLSLDLVERHAGSQFHEREPVRSDV